MASCVSCGTALAETAKFCTRCGSQVADGRRADPSGASTDPTHASIDIPERNREKTLLYAGIALAVLVIGVLLTPYPTMLLDNYRHVRTDLADDDASAEASLGRCIARHAALNSDTSSSPMQAGTTATIINGEPRTDYYFGDEFTIEATTGPALVYNSPNSERGLLLYECPAGMELKGRWVRGGADGSERWLRLTRSRYVRDNVFSSSPDSLTTSKIDNDQNASKVQSDATADLIAYVGKSPQELVNGVAFTDHPSVRQAVSLATGNQKITDFLLEPQGPAYSIESHKGYLVYGQCEAHNCNGQNAALVISRDGKFGQVCYINLAESNKANWYLGGRAVRTSNGCPGWDGSGKVSLDGSFTLQEPKSEMAFTAIQGAGAPGCTFEASGGSLIGEWLQSSAYSRGDRYFATLALGINGRKINFDIDQEYAKRGASSSSSGYELKMSRFKQIAAGGQTEEDGVFIPSKATGQITVKRDGASHTVAINETCFFD